MPVPDYQTLMRPVLAYAAYGQDKKVRGAINALADEPLAPKHERVKPVGSDSKRLRQSGRVGHTRRSPGQRVASRLH